MTDNSVFEDIFQGVPLMAILRGMGVERSLATATRAWDLGITAVEIPVQTPTDVEALRAVAEAGRARGLTVGAGTVVTLEHVRQAADAGAAFTVSPGLDIDVVRASHEAGLPALPGVSTATEVQRALGEGLTWLKAFPASLLGTGWFPAMRGPFPQARFVATGGMDSGNARSYLDAGVRVVAVGSALEDESQLAALAQLLA
ncbi:bifunctional 4-hydroxy-2-oxoglutarate aldolase/2-dehydro-3-deoxy-phosphogluconate aldolase [Microbacterium sp.]|uniref:bifunctional 4-hydroxy-2-oxoglutarate aldolase/2-dehydro-3-deoxy-phosphogluconate aldolase n=1 Tax=Microbacterium sp. TaxID=51671 RepID=UPI002810F8DD|nr:bifunctional 4-hydroxy-2-oxoglutarate aldolase/2-dehydro-3-deoxy-phosphogluconate aldolase [Microbacterium sp.]